MLRLALPTHSTSASVEAYPNRYYYEVTPSSSSEDLDTSSSEDEAYYGGYDGHPDEETGKRCGGGSLGKCLTWRAKVGPTGGADKAAGKGAGKKAGKKASKGETRAAERAAKRTAKKEIKQKQAKEVVASPGEQESKQKELNDDANKRREERAQERDARREKAQRRIDEGIDRAERSKAAGADTSAACLRHCGTSCGSVLFQSVCACVAIAGAFWVGFIVLSVFEVIGISSLPPGIAYGAKVGDVYRL